MNRYSPAMLTIAITLLFSVVYASNIAEKEDSIFSFTSPVESRVNLSDRNDFDHVKSVSYISTSLNQQIQDQQSVYTPTYFLFAG
ncbi:MAG TPA: hypothetical protein VJ044_16650, partial [Candidatus Hodarchaeales archaeon]|nr:hypothetical protein [Candidatus Hodarchaeales archaeon]